MGSVIEYVVDNSKMYRHEMGSYVDAALPVYFKEFIDKLPSKLDTFNLGVYSSEFQYAIRLEISKRLAEKNIGKFTQQDKKNLEGFKALEVDFGDEFFKFACEKYDYLSRILNTMDILGRENTRKLWESPNGEEFVVNFSVDYGN